MIVLSSRKYVVGDNEWYEMTQEIKHPSERDVLLECGHHAGPASGVDDAEEDVDEVEVCEVVDAGSVTEPKEIVGQRRE